MARRKKYGFSFSWKRATGLSAAKGKLSRKLGIPLARSGRQRKIGRLVTGGGCCLSLLWLSVLIIVGGFAVNAIAKMFHN